ncbi:MAG: hypothetical protein M9894_37770 [Planctomycetes bacterium]|nr:hypothetical protein [Planctomycetota bacterium]
MVDQELRSLERRWRHTGATEDEAAYLQACVRRGALGRERLVQLASLGDPAALLAVGSDDLPPIDERWVAALLRQDPHMLVGVLLALAHEVQRSDPGSSSDAELVTDLASVEAWLRCPCDEHLVVIIRGLGARDSEWSFLASSIDAVGARTRAYAAHLFVRFAFDRLSEPTAMRTMAAALKSSLEAGR